MLGGSGKTPIVAALARLLAAAGERPAILTRGYGRREISDGVVVVGDGKDVLATPSQSGDEPYMLARALPGVPVLVSPDRYLAGRLAEGRFASTVHLLDDGFQHLQLARDVDLVVMSKSDLDERLLPAGRLREPLRAARAADALLIVGTDQDLAAITEKVGIATAFWVIARYHELRLVAPFGASLSTPGGRRAVAVAGIARPERFFAALRERGWEVVRELVFRDHHWFAARDVARIQRVAVETGADMVITTEKDAVRLADAGASPWAFLPLEVTIEPADRFASWLAGRLGAARRHSTEAA